MDFSAWKPLERSHTTDVSFTRPSTVARWQESSLPGLSGGGRRFRNPRRLQGAQEDPLDLLCPSGESETDVTRSDTAPPTPVVAVITTNYDALVSEQTPSRPLWPRPAPVRWPLLRQISTQSYQRVLATTELSHIGSESNDSLTGQDMRLGATKLILAQVLDARSKDLNRMFDMLAALSAPKTILAACIQTYDETHREQVLLVACSLLERIGRKAWPVLRGLAKSSRPEMEYFVGLIASFVGASEEERARALQDLAKHPDAAVRAAVLEALSEFSTESKRQLLQILRNDLDAEIREEAEESLAVLD